MYLLTKPTYIFGDNIYRVVGENNKDETYLVSTKDTGYYSNPDNLFTIDYEDVAQVDSNKSLLENKLQEV